MFSSWPNADGGAPGVGHDASIALLEAFLRDEVPEVSVVVAHGQMAAGELDDRMNAFYDGKYDVLLATTIVERKVDPRDRMRARAAHRRPPCTRSPAPEREVSLIHTHVQHRLGGMARALDQLLERARRALLARDGICSNNSASTGRARSPS